MNTNTNKRGSQASSAKRLKHSTLNNDLESITKKASRKEEGENVNVVLLDPNSFLSSEEKVFSIDHIVELILLKLDKQTLMTCRLLSSRWAYFGSKALQNIVSITFFRFAGQSHGKFVWDHWKRKLLIENLIDLMNSTATEFPCTSFCFHNGMKESLTAALDPYFNAHGFHIKKLKFIAILQLDDLRSILFNPALNFQQLSLKGMTLIYDKSKTPSLINKAPLLDLSARGETHLKKNLEGPKLVLKNLKVFKCDNLDYDTIICQILELSPNLIEVSVNQDNLHCLLKPTNRLHLVKKLKIDTDVTDVDPADFDSLEAVVKHSQNNWAVEILEFRSQEEGCEELPSKCLAMLSAILQSCSATCKKFVWFRNNQIPENFQIPQMPRLKHLSFNYMENDDTGLPINIFPEEMSLENVFPNLKSLRIGSAYSMKNLPIENIFGDDDPLPVSKVTKVILEFHPDENLLGSFKKMFPNATIHMNEDDSEEEEEEDEDDSEEDEGDTEEN